MNNKDTAALLGHDGPHCDRFGKQFTEIEVL
jgi:hypothetical protein